MKITLIAAGELYSSGKISLQDYEKVVLKIEKEYIQMCQKNSEIEIRMELDQLLSSLI